MVKTEKATEGKIASTIKTLQTKITQRDEKLAVYTEKLNGLFGDGYQLRNNAENEELKKLHREIKVLETQIQTRSL